MKLIRAMLNRLFGTSSSKGPREGACWDPRMTEAEPEEELRRTLTTTRLPILFLRARLLGAAEINDFYHLDSYAEAVLPGPDRTSVRLSEHGHGVVAFAVGGAPHDLAIDPAVPAP